MNYRHAYHAGNFADVFKHIVLIDLIKALSRKENAFCYLDTHAGIGKYDLLSGPAQKNKEYVSGVHKLLDETNPPELIKEYLACVNGENIEGNKLRYYPGSPSIAKYFLRPQDRMVLSELQGDDYNILKSAFYYDKRIGVHHLDGYQMLRGSLPPKERRALVLIDPPYEKPDEISKVVVELRDAIERFDSGVFALWYPIKDRRSIERFHRSLSLKINKPFVAVELSIYPENVATHLNGSGMIIVNPPWQFVEEMKAVLPWLWQALSPNKQGRFDIIT